jgi:hypothetical protein
MRLARRPSRPPRAARALPIVAVLVAGVAACGSSGPSGSPTPDPRLNLTTPKATSTPAPAPVTRGEAAVIRGWSDTLRHGHVTAAARYFALPSVVANGNDPAVVRTRGQAEQFNRILSCGAKVVRLERAPHNRVLATFRLTDRPGGGCGPGKGALAYTVFRIRGGRIKEWLRVQGPADLATQPS